MCMGIIKKISQDVNITFDVKFVYIIKCLDYYKIGYATNVSSRLSQLQTGNPFSLKLIVKIESCNAEELEKEIHSRFADYLIRGEWFSLNNDLIMDLCWEYNVNPLVSLDQLNSEKEKRESLEEIKKVQEAYNAHIKNHYVQEEKVALLVEYWNKKIELYDKELNDSGIRSIKNLLKKFSFEDVIKAMDGAEKTYLKCDDDDSCSKAFNKIHAVAITQKTQKGKPFLKDLLYIRGILKNRFGGFIIGKTLPLLEDAINKGWTIDALKEKAKESKNWSNFKVDIIK